LVQCMMTPGIWCKLAFALQLVYVAVGPPPEVEDTVFAVLALAKKDHKPQADGQMPSELVVGVGDVLWVRRNTSVAWAYARNKHGDNGWVPDSVLSFARPVTVAIDFTGSSLDQPQPQLSAKLGDAVWTVQKHHADWTWAFGRDGHGWLPNWALKLPVDKTLPDATPAMVGTHFAANAQARHRQLSLSNGEMVLIAGQLVTDIWVFALNMAGQRGWVPGRTLQSLEAAIVLQTFNVGGASGGPHPQVSAVKGSTVWVSNRSDSGWIFVRSQGCEGWMPIGALLGTMTFASAAPGVPVGVLVLGLVALVLTACVIVAMVLRQRMVATEHDTSKSELERGMVATTSKNDIEPKTLQEKPQETPPIIAPRRNKRQSFREGGLDAQSFREGGLDAQSFRIGFDAQSFVEGRSFAEPIRPTLSSFASLSSGPPARYHGDVMEPKSKSFAGEEVTYFM